MSTATTHSYFTFQDLQRAVVNSLLTHFEPSFVASLDAASAAASDDVDFVFPVYAPLGDLQHWVVGITRDYVSEPGEYREMSIETADSTEADVLMATVMDELRLFHLAFLLNAGLVSNVPVSYNQSWALALMATVPAPFRAELDGIAAELRSHLVRVPVAA